MPYLNLTKLRTLLGIATNDCLFRHWASELTRGTAKSDHLITNVRRIQSWECQAENAHVTQLYAMVPTTTLTTVPQRHPCGH